MFSMDFKENNLGFGPQADIDIAINVANEVATALKIFLQRVRPV